MQEMRMGIKLGAILLKKNMTQKELVALIDEHRKKRSEETGQAFKKTRPAAVSELYNNQRKSLNKDLLEDIATVLNITDTNELIEFYTVDVNQLELPLIYPEYDYKNEEGDQ